MLPLLLACATPTPQTAPEPSPQAPAQAAPTAQSSLARALYALGPEGETARTLLWLRELALTPEQITALCQQSAEVGQLWQDYETQARQHQALRREALAPTLDPLVQALAAGPLPQAQAQTHAQDLAALDLPESLQARGDAVRASLSAAEALWPQLSAQQQSDLGSGVFLLRALDHGDGSTPRALPEPWQDGDFSTLRRSSPSPDLGISGLFELEDGDPIDALSTTDRQIVLALVLAQPGTHSACEAMAPPPTP